MISIIIPLFNKENQIANTLNSVFKQTFQDFEILIVDDGSTDSSLSVVSKFSDSRLRVISQTNAGVSAARNRGIEEAKGEYIAFLDADDEWDKDYLETQLTLVHKYPNCDVFSVNYRFEDYLGNLYDTKINHLPFGDDSDGILTNYFEIASVSHPPIWTSAVMISKSALESVGGFPIGIKSGEDLLTWARLAIGYKIAYSKIPRALYHLDVGYEYCNEPVRRQDKGDPVGKELRKLLNDNPSVPGLRKYLSHWHKMRASVAIRFNERLETIRESISALKYNPGNMKVVPFIFLACLPSAIGKRIIALKKH